MLKLAQERLDAETEKSRVSFRLAYLPDPNFPGSHGTRWSATACCTSADPQTLWESIAHLGAPGAAVQVMDLIRPDSEDRARNLINQYAADEPDILREDFYNSLLASYTLVEIHDQLSGAGLGGLKVEKASDPHSIVSGRLQD